MKTTFELPEGFGELCRVNLQKDKKIAVWVNLAAYAIAFGMLFASRFFPTGAFSVKTESFADWAIMLGLLLVGLVVYMTLHELVHGVFIRIFSGKKANYGFNGLYAYAGSTAYFNRLQYIVIALSPIVILGLVLTVALVVVPKSLFWSVYLIQIMNLSGAAGDLYITVKTLCIKKGVLIQDTGIEMAFFAEKE